jgi:hypothetical protein
MGWVSPTGHNDPDTGWRDHTQAYNDNTGNYAEGFHSLCAPNYGYLELTLGSAISCDKVRIYIKTSRNLDIDVYYSGAWHNIYSGSPSSGQYVEKSIGSTESVDKARILNNEVCWLLKVCDFDFNEVAAPPAYVPKVIMVD